MIRYINWRQTSTLNLDALANVFKALHFQSLFESVELKKVTVEGMNIVTHPMNAIVKLIVTNRCMTMLVGWKWPS
jgi:hypothetical protein